MTNNFCDWGAVNKPKPDPAITTALVGTRNAFTTLVETMNHHSSTDAELIRRLTFLKGQLLKMEIQVIGNSSRQ